MTARRRIFLSGCNISCNMREHGGNTAVLRLPCTVAGRYSLWSVTALENRIIQRFCWLSGISPAITVRRTRWFRKRQVFSETTFRGDYMSSWAQNKKPQRATVQGKLVLTGLLGDLIHGLQFICAGQLALKWLIVPALSEIRIVFDIIAISLIPCPPITS